MIFTLATSASQKIRCGKIKLPGGFDVATPALLVRTSRFLPNHLTPDNLDKCLPIGSSLMEMNIDHLVENEFLKKASPLNLAKLSGIGNRPICLAMRVSSASDNFKDDVINGDDFVTVHNATGNCRFEMNSLADILPRFEPSIFFSPFDAHVLPISPKRIRKAVDRSLKYEQAALAVTARSGMSLISSVIGAGSEAEMHRQIGLLDRNTAGVAFTDMHKLSNDCRRDRLAAAVGKLANRGLLRIYRGVVPPSEVRSLVEHVDVIDTSYVDDLVEQGQALQLDVEALTEQPALDMWREEYFGDFQPLLKGCACPACQRYTRSYVHHLLKSHEMLGSALLMMHNLHQYHQWLRGMAERE